MERNDRVTRETTSFFALLKIVTLKPLIFNFSFLFAVCSALVFFLNFKSVSDFSHLVDYVSNTIAPICGTILGIVIAGLAVLISLTQGKLLSLFLQRNILQKFLFPFWFISISWGVTLLLSIVIKLLQFSSNDLLLNVLTTDSFLFVYSLFSTISLMGHAIRLGIHLASIERNDP